jgi:hypothetical protein
MSIIKTPLTGIKIARNLSQKQKMLPCLNISLITAVPGVLPVIQFIQLVAIHVSFTCLDPVHHPKGISRRHSCILYTLTSLISYPILTDYLQALFLNSLHPQFPNLLPNSHGLNRKDRLTKPDSIIKKPNQTKPNQTTADGLLNVEKTNHQSQVTNHLSPLLTNCSHRHYSNPSSP